MGQAIIIILINIYFVITIWAIYNFFTDEEIEHTIGTLLLTVIIVPLLVPLIIIYKILQIPLK